MSTSNDESYWSSENRFDDANIIIKRVMFTIYSCLYYIINAQASLIYFFLYH